MKKSSSDFIFRLIKSLTKSEKRYFKIYSNRFTYKDKQKYLDLFDAIDKQKEYDEEALKKKFEGEKFLKHFPTVKSRLKDMVLTCLREFTKDKSHRSKLEEQLFQVNFLFERNFVKEAIPIAKRIYKKALDSELFDIAIHALELTIPIEGILIEDLDEVHEKKLHCIQLLRNQIDFSWLKKKFFQMNRNHAIVRSEKQAENLDYFMKHPLLQRGDTAITFITKSDFHQIHAMYAGIKGNYLIAYQYWSASIQEMEQIRDKISLFPRQYWGGYLNLLYIAMILGKYDEVIQGFALLSEKAKKYHFSKNSAFERVYFEWQYKHLLTAYTNQCKFKEAEKIMLELIEKFHHLKKILSSNQKVAFQMIMAGRYLISGEADKALNWLQMIPQKKSASVGDEFICVARVLEIFAHYELQNFLLLESLIRSARRFFQNAIHAHQAEKLILQYISKVINLVSKEEQHTIWEELKMSLLPLVEIEYERYFFDYFPFINWVEAKIQNRPLKEILIEKYQNTASLQ